MRRRFPYIKKIRIAFFHFFKCFDYANIILKQENFYGKSR